MDDRKQRVLMTVVRLYSMGGEPVGSQLLCRHLDMVVSTATLRSEMAALTRLGLLEQPHTSAGRVPTVEGFRFYTQQLLSHQTELSPAKKREIDSIFLQLDYDPEKLVQGAAKALSDMLQCVVVASAPHIENMSIVHFDAMQVGRYTAALLAVTSAGGLHTRVAKLDEEFSAEELAQIVSVLNKSLRFVSTKDASFTDFYEMANNIGLASKKFLPLLLAGLEMLSGMQASSILFEGQQYLLRWPELRADLYSIMELLSTPKSLQSMTETPLGQTYIVFGEDMQPPISNFCFISRRYHAGNGLTGGLAVAGPSRLKFSEIFPKLEYFSKVLGESMIGMGA